MMNIVYKKEMFIIHVSLILALTTLIGGCSSPKPKISQRGIDFRIKEKMTDDELINIEKSVNENIKLGDFKRAGAVLNEANNRRLNSTQNYIINSLKKSLRRISFLHHVPVELRILSSKHVYVLEENPVISFEIFNLSDQTLEIPAISGLSWLPWSDDRRSYINAKITVSDISRGDGAFRSNKMSKLIEIESPLILEPGSSGAIDFKFSPSAFSDPICRRMEIDGELIPGGLQTGSLDWGMIRLNFPTVTIHFLSKDDLVIAESPKESFLTACDDHDGKKVMLSAILMDSEERWMAVDRIIRMLSEFPVGGQRCLMSVLKWLTGEDFKYELNNWMDWWDIQRKEKLAKLSGFMPPLLAMSCLGMLIPSNSTACVVNDIDSKYAEEKQAYDEEQIRSIRQGLSDPYYCRRYASIKKLQETGSNELGLIERLLSDPDQRIRSSAADVIGKFDDVHSQQLLLEALRKEDCYNVKQHIVQALATADPLPESEALHDLCDSNEFLNELYINSALISRLEKILHYDRIPGFFDGQFSSLWKISEEATKYLGRIARDCDMNFHIRVLAIMALHEKAEDEIHSVLAPLIINPVKEVKMEWDEWNSLPLNEDLILQSRKRCISKYSRFSLAKAGIIAYNLAQIRAMDDYINDNRQALYRPSSILNGGRKLWDPKKIFCKSLILSIGYHYQQFDDYKNAEKWYRRLTKEFAHEDNASLLAEAHYNLSCLYSMTGDTEAALLELKHAVDKGFMDFSWMDRDRDLDNIRNRSEYKDLRKIMVAPKMADPENKDQGK